MSHQLTIALPSDIMKWLVATAERDYRTPGAQAAWLISEAQIRELNYRASHGLVTKAEASQRLLDELHLLHLAAGAPSGRGISRTVIASGGKASRSVIHTAISGQHVPSWPILEEIVHALDGDVARFRAMWADTQTAS